MENLRCNLCPEPGSYADALDTARVPSNVREFKSENFTVWRCRACGSLHSKEEIDYSRYYAHYPMKKQWMDFHARVAMGVRYRRLVRAGLKKDHSVLDFGCGVGHFVRFLRAKGISSVAGYDKFNDASADPAVLDRKYDFVVSQDVIEHVDSPRELLTELSRCLAPDGVLCVGTVDAERIDLRDPNHRGGPLHQPHHRHLLSYRALLRLAADCGLTPIQTYHRWYYSSWWLLGCNAPFIDAYITRAGDFDSGFEPFQLGLMLRSPRLVFLAVFGCYVTDINMTVLFKKADAGTRLTE
ncbi:MAG TPA: class I SAM-dependent methyltransferase [Bdellovibrionota bacterium]|nr:class I SAM-dependent methyltransferase [Bdellovibrionota bacterium]